MPVKFPQVSSRDGVRVEVDTEDLPDLVTVNLEDENPDNFEVEEVDDTPEADRGRPTRVDDPTDVTEDELRNYSQRAQGRIKQVTFERHSERRGREQAERERDQAIEIARRLQAERDELQRNSMASTKVLADAMIKEREEALRSAKAELQRAHDEGDGAAIAEATTKVTTIGTELTMIRAQIPREGQKQQQQPTPEKPQQGQQSGQPVQMHPRVAAWVDENRSWFQKDQRKTALAYAIHNELTAEGVKPSDPEYVRRLDAGLSEMFSDHKPQSNSAPRAQAGSRGANTVGGGSRATNTEKSERTVQLTSSELAIAKQLGVSPQAYAKQKVAYQRKLGTKESAS